MAEMSNLISIGNRIKELRNIKKWRQEDFANEMGVTRTVVGKWETGLQDFKTEHIIKMADIFGVTCDYLLRGVKAENVDIYKTLGLNDYSISVLNEWYNFPDVADNIETINRLLKNEEIIKLISEYLNVKIISEQVMAIMPTGEVRLFKDIYEYQEDLLPMCCEINEEYIGSAFIYAHMIEDALLLNIENELRDLKKRGTKRGNDNET